LREGGVAVRYVLSAALWLHTRTRPAVVRRLTMDGLTTMLGSLRPTGH
jgi:hypothetical protein